MAERTECPEHIIMLMLDALRPDYLTIYEPPHLQRLLREGTWVAEARSVFPSTTTTNQTSFVTGSLPARTGIPNNSRYDRQTDAIVTRLRDNRCPTIAEVVRAYGWSSASVSHFMLENRGVDQYLQGDMDNLIDLLASDTPNLAVLYHSDIDSVGHRYGPFSPQMREAVTHIDGRIGQMLALLERNNLSHNTVVVVASDHGMVPNDGAPVLPELLAVVDRLNLRVAFDTSQIGVDTELVALQFGASFLYWRPHMRHPEREKQVVEALSSVAGLDVLLADDIRALGSDPELVGDIVLSPREGWQITPASRPGGIHGTQAASRSTMLFWGPGVRQGHVIHRACITDIAPTLLSMVGMPVPESVDGSVLHEAFVTPAERPTAAVRDVAAARQTE
ncbi:MAG: alkaline phosphatase family protein [Limnochordia bacterium]|jgi:arylsulfatase A-like enzyme